MRLRRRVRPVLLLLVFSGFLLIVGTTASGQALFVGEDTQRALLESAAGSDTATVRSFVGLNLTPADLGAGGPTTQRREMLRKGLALMTERGGILHAALIAPDGTILVSDDGAGEGAVAPSTPELTTSLADAVVIPSLVASDRAGSVAPLDAPMILREYVPIMAGGRVYAVAVIWRDAGPILAHLDEARIHVVASTIVAGLISVIVLFFVFRAAQQRLSRQAAPARRGHPARPADRRAQPRRAGRSARRPDGRARAWPARRRRSRSSISTTSACSTTPTGMPRATWR